MRKTSAQKHSRGVIVRLEYIINYILKQEAKKGKHDDKHIKCRQLYRWFSRYVIAAMLVDGRQKIAH